MRGSNPRMRVACSMLAAVWPTASTSGPVSTTASPFTSTFVSPRILVFRGNFSPRKFSMMNSEPFTVALSGKWLYTIFISYVKPSLTPATMFRRWAANVPTRAASLRRGNSQRTVACWAFPSAAAHRCESPTSNRSLRVPATQGGGSCRHVRGPSAKHGRRGQGGLHVRDEDRLQPLPAQGDREGLRIHHRKLPRGEVPTEDEDPRRNKGRGERRPGPPHRRGRRGGRSDGREHRTGDANSGLRPADLPGRHLYHEEARGGVRWPRRRSRRWRPRRRRRRRRPPSRRSPSPSRRSPRPARFAPRRRPNSWAGPSATGSGKKGPSTTSASVSARSSRRRRRRRPPRKKKSPLLRRRRRRPRRSRKRNRSLRRRRRERRKRKRSRRNRSTSRGRSRSLIRT